MNKISTSFLFMTDTPPYFSVFFMHINFSTWQRNSFKWNINNRHTENTFKHNFTRNVNNLKASLKLASTFVVLYLLHWQTNKIVHLFIIAKCSTLTKTELKLKKNTSSFRSIVWNFPWYAFKKVHKLNKSSCFSSHSMTLSDGKVHINLLFQLIVT